MIDIIHFIMRTLSTAIKLFSTNLRGTLFKKNTDDMQTRDDRGHATIYDYNHQGRNGSLCKSTMEETRYMVIRFFRHANYATCSRALRSAPLIRPHPW